MGANLSLGANVLMMGPFIEIFGKDPAAYYAQFTRSLVAFQFGFLGAYVYFIGSLTRAYFTLDLTSHTFVDGTIRMVVASILALVLSFGFYGSPRSESVSIPALIDAPAAGPAVPPSAADASPAVETAIAMETPPDAGAATEGVPGGSIVKADSAIPASLSLLPILSFFFGFYPKRAFLAIERVVLLLVKNIAGDSYRALPLSMLAGMSYTHELRLEREGFDNVENLSHADAVDLAIRTCFSYGQLKQWIDEAWLATHLREDYPVFVRCTGITSSEELQRILSRHDSRNGDALEQLTADLSPDSAARQAWMVRLTTLQALLDANAGRVASVERQERESG